MNAATSSKRIGKVDIATTNFKDLIQLNLLSHLQSTNFNVSILMPGVALKESKNSKQGESQLACRADAC